MCRKCGGTSANKLIKLVTACKQSTTQGDRNLKAFAKGRAPEGFPGWPYPKLNKPGQDILENIQRQIHHIQDIYDTQHVQTDTESDSEDTVYPGDTSQTGIQDTLMQTQTDSDSD